MAKVLIGNTEVAPVVEVRVEELETKYGATIGNILGDVDANGAYRKPTEPFTLDLSSVKSIAAPYGLAYNFYKNEALSGLLVIGLEGNLGADYAMERTFSDCSGLTSVDLGSLTTISGSHAMVYSFYKCKNITSVDLGSLTTVSGSYAMGWTFSDCSGLTSVDLGSLTTISDSNAMVYSFYKCKNITSVDLGSLTTVSGSYAMGWTFSDCSGLTSVDLGSLTTISGSYAMASCFVNCTKLSKISFPGLKEILPANTQTQFAAMFSGASALTEIHFPVNMQSRIEQMTGYPTKFGASNATIYFDLPSTAEE